jgi:hypothetical protein
MITSLLTLAIVCGATFLVVSHHNLRVEERKYHIRDKFWGHFIEPFSIRSWMVTDLSGMYTVISVLLLVLRLIYAMFCY